MFKKINAGFIHHLPGKEIRRQELYYAAVQNTYHTALGDTAVTDALKKKRAEISEDMTSE